MNCTLNKTESNTASARPQHLTPVANLVETKDGYLLQAELPGVSKDGLEVTVTDGELVIVGRRTVTAPSGQAVYRESRTLDYRRTFELDPAIDAAKITAKIEQGVLTLELPKAEAVKPRKITVAA